MVTKAPNNLVYERPNGFTDTPTHYCPGCTHGVAHRLIAEVLEEMNVLDRTIGVAPVGCSVFAYNYFDTRAREFLKKCRTPRPRSSRG